MRSSLGTENGGPTVHIAGELASAPPPPSPACSLPAHPHTFPGAHREGVRGRESRWEGSGHPDPGWSPQSGSGFKTEQATLLRHS